ncbi:MAG TPA: hypothetical protein VLT61_14605 [Anaeromyxobacteraceae bacterium]|nr:hypothetical protein [Anaeromyxobacteraceae bacterium]
MKRRLVRQSQPLAIARLVLTLVAVTSLPACKGLLEATADSSRSKDNQKFSAPTTNSTSSFTKVKKSKEALGALLYGVSSDGAHAEMGARFLSANAVQLRQDLAFGAGPAIDDLAGIAEIRADHAGAFGRLLQEHREELLDAADARRLTPARATACLGRIGELIAHHPVLDEDRVAWLARHAPSAG